MSFSKTSNASAHYKRFLDQLNTALTVISLVPDEHREPLYNALFDNVPPEVIIQMASINPKVLEVSKQLLIDEMHTIVAEIKANKSIADDKNNELKHDIKDEIQESESNEKLPKSAHDCLYKKISDHMETLPLMEGERWGDYENRVEDEIAKAVADETAKQIAALNAQREVANQTTATPASNARPIKYVDSLLSFPKLPSRNQTVGAKHTVSVNRTVGANQTVSANKPVGANQTVSANKPVAKNNKPERKHSTTCELWFAGQNCKHDDKECWFLHDKKKDGTPFNWRHYREVRDGKDYYIYTSKPNSPWGIYKCPILGIWMYEFSANGEWPGIPYNYDKYCEMIENNMKK